MASNTVKRQDHNVGDDWQAFDDGASGPRSLGVSLCGSDGGYMANPDFLIEVAKGNIAKHSLLEVTGSNGDIDAGGTETLWNGANNTRVNVTSYVLLVDD